jgi:alpha-ketoglutarate-dependent taurine dioxygenase
MKFPTINLLIYFIAYVFVNCVANENKTCEETRRIMGYVYQLDKPLSDFEAADFDDLKNAVYRHGVIVVRNVDLSAEEQMKITESIGYPLSSKNSKMLNIRPNRWLHDTVDGIFLAGNIDNTGFYEDVAQRSEYWHHDCNFMPQNRNWVFNILHTRVMPESGGDTGFIDTVVEDEDLADIFKNSKITVALGTILILFVVSFLF